MKAISQILSILLPVIYLVVVFLNAYIFFGRNKNLETKVPLMIIILIIFHTAQIILRGMAIEMLPLVTKFDAISFLAFAIVILILIIESSSENKTTIFFAVLLKRLKSPSDYFFEAGVCLRIFVCSFIYNA